MENEIIELKKLIDKADHIVFFGGAGVSTESGLLDFRSPSGLYNLKSKYGESYETMLSNNYFYSYPEKFYAFYFEFMVNHSAKPNFAHLYLARLEKEKDLTIITQNIDGLHQAAGSTNVIELHGSIHHYHCLNCGKEFTLKEVEALGPVPYCPGICHGLIKPDVVLYGENLNQDVLVKAIEALKRADLLIVAGTSLNVYPAAQLIYAYLGNNIVVINQEDLNIEYRKIKLFIKGKVGEVFKKVSEL